MGLPALFGRYTLHKKIAVGGMAELFMATHHGESGFDRTVAIKRILPNLALDEDFVAMFIDEAKIAVQLSHPSIAQILDLGCIEGRYFITQEYVHGRDLRSILKSELARGSAVPVPIVVYTFLRVCEALHHAHIATGPAGQPLGLIHRDVSPQNIIISFEGEVKVVDFGLARAAGRAINTQTGVVKGKLAYMAPEQARGVDIDHRADIFAAGICMFELLTGKPLFHRKTDVDTILAVQAGHVPRLLDVAQEMPSMLDTILARALAATPDARYATAMEMHDDLETFLYTTRDRTGRLEMSVYLQELFPEEGKAVSDRPPAAPQSRDTIPAPESEAPSIEADIPIEVTAPESESAPGAGRDLYNDDDDDATTILTPFWKDEDV